MSRPLSLRCGRGTDGRVNVFLQTVGVFTTPIALFVGDVLAHRRVPRVRSVTSRDHSESSILPFR